jgi:hypothetical protein
VVKTATAGGLFQKYAYDGLGRLTATYTSFDLDETAYTDADDVTGDTVIEQTRRAPSAHALVHARLQ